MQRFAPFILTLTILFSSQAARAARALGIDVYHGDGTINWTSVKNAGYSFAFAKASGGIKPIPYSGHNYGSTYLTTAIRPLDLWYARYDFQDPQTGNANLSGTVFNHWELWQYSDVGHVPGVGNGTTTNCDVDVANGD